MPTSARRARCRTREGRGDRSEAEGAARLGRREVRLLCCAGWDSKGQSRGRRTTTQGPQVANGVSDRGPQQVARVLATGALGMFTVDLVLSIDKRATGALGMFTVGLVLSIDKRATGALGMFAVGLVSSIDKRATGAVAVFIADPRTITYKRATGAGTSSSKKITINHDNVHSSRHRGV